MLSMFVVGDVSFPRARLTIRGVGPARSAAAACVVRAALRRMRAVRARPLLRLGPRRRRLPGVHARVSTISQRKKEVNYLVHTFDVLTFEDTKMKTILVKYNKNAKIEKQRLLTMLSVGNRQR